VYQGKKNTVENQDMKVRYHTVEAEEISTDSIDARLVQIDNLTAERVYGNEVKAGLAGFIGEHYTIDAQRRMYNDEWFTLKGSARCIGCGETSYESLMCTRCQEFLQLVSQLGMQYKIDRLRFLMEQSDTFWSLMEVVARMSISGVFGTQLEELESRLS